MAFNRIGEKHGGMIQPPLGYAKNVNGWQTFLVKQLKNAVLAPAEIFQPVPPTPKRNMFKVSEANSKILKRSSE